MGRLLTAIKNTFRMQRDNAAAALEDDARDSRYQTEDTIRRNQQNIAAAQREVDGFTTNVAGVVANNKTLIQQIADATANRAKFDGIARMIAPKVKTGQAPQSDLEQAVAEVNKFDKQIAALKSQLDQNQKLEASLRKQLNDARNKVANAETNSTIRAAQLQSATLRKSMAKSATAFGSSSGLSALDGIEKEVQKATAEAEAFEELAAAPTDSLEEKYGNPELAASVDAYLNPA